MKKKKKWETGGCFYHPNTLSGTIGEDNDTGTKNSLFDVLHTTHVLPIRPIYTPDGPSDIVHKRDRSTRTNDDPARHVQTAVAPVVGRVCAAYASDHAL